MVEMSKRLLRMLVLVLAVAAESVVVAEPLHEQIDRLIEAKLPSAPAPVADDTQFLRRVYLDLLGRIPSPQEARAFLADQSADKRARLIEQLLAAPEFPWRMAHVLDDWLMERRTAKGISRQQWLEYLRRAVEENKPLNRLLGELLRADRNTPAEAAAFLLAREAEPNAVTRDVGRALFGVDLQCAQCHDHPDIDDYTQDVYYGLFAFYTRTGLFTDRKTKKTFLTEKAEGEASYTSVFDSSIKKERVLPCPPGGKPLADPKLSKDELYLVPPAKGVQPVPRYSRRARLAQVIEEGSNLWFRRNVANRLWAMMMGRGLVHPVDYFHGDNPPSHPKLLDLLADYLLQNGFDLRDFLRQLALSRTYQRSSLPPKTLPAEMLAPELFAVGQLKPLRAEQLAWSVMEATGTSTTTREALRSRFLRDPKMRDIFQLDAKRAALLDRMVQQELARRMDGNVKAFVREFAPPSGEPQDQFHATAGQALFMNNGNLIRAWLAPRSANLTGRLLKIKDTNKLAEELYLSVLTRRPDPGERQAVAEYLKGREKDRTAAIQEMAWALLCSVEFRFNH